MKKLMLLSTIIFVMCAPIRTVTIPLGSGTSFITEMKNRGEVVVRTDTIKDAYSQKFIMIQYR